MNTNAQQIAPRIGIWAALLILSLHPLQAFGTQKPPQIYDIVIAGAGTGGVSAAIQAARMGSKVALLEESDWIGGQMGAAGVGNMDEGKLPPPSGFYAEFLSHMQTFYNAHGKSVGTCYWQTKTHCFDPSAIRQILNEMINEVNSGKTNRTHGHIDLYLQDRVMSVLSSGDKVTGAVTSQNQTFLSTILIDATEFGDVLPLTPARYRSGRSIGEDNQNSCIQDITYTMVIKKYPKGVPPELQLHNPPPGYELWAKSWRHKLRIDGNTENRSLPVSFAYHNAYRGFPDLSNPENYDGTDSQRVTRTSLNWFNDFPALTSIFDFDTRRKIVCDAKLKTISQLYYIQNEMRETQWSIANDEGYDTAYNRDVNSCPEIPAEFKTIENNMPQLPYVRESRRLIGIYTLTGGDIRRDSKGGKSFNSFTDTIAVGNYPDDLHNCKSAADLETGLDLISDFPPDFRFGPFQIPLRSLIPEKVDGLLAAEKNISVSRLANGAIRLQPITMMTGQASGTLAALSVIEHLQPRQITADDVQGALLQSGSILVREPMPDIQTGTRLWQAAQFAAVHHWISMDDSGFQPHKQLTRADGARILVSAFLPAPSEDSDEIDTTRQPDKPSYEDVPFSAPDFNSIEALHSRGVAPICANTPIRFCPNDPITLNEFLSTLIHLSWNKSEIPAQYLANLKEGVSGLDDKPITRQDAATILYNTALMRVWEKRNAHTR
jgi:hypothetical protein